MDSFAATKSHQAPQTGDPVNEPQKALEETNKDSQVLEAIAALKTLIDTKIEEVKTDMQLMRQDARNLAERVTNTETVLQEATENTADLRIRVSELEKKVATLKARSEDA
ncbi:uncharacterized protein [Ambystoma mexicanum]|uniref:uncharacterized protein n=1 Tax=Ambystoma mexicanum TaxID=8296 RepID=UPI0037E7F231